MNAVDHAYELLRAHTTGDLQFEEHLRPIKYVIVPDGRLVAPAMVAMLRTLDTVLHVPEIGDDALVLQVTLLEFDEHGEAAARDPDDPPLSGGALADRWRIHHGDPPDVRWAFLDIDAARLEGHVLDGEALVRPNPLAPDEARLCRLMNGGRTDDLRRLCTERAHVNVEAPVMVAIDPLGLDVRGRFDVIRVPAPSPMENAEQAEAVIEGMVGGRHGGAEARRHEGRGG